MVATASSMVFMSPVFLVLLLQAAAFTTTVVSTGPNEDADAGAKPLPTFWASTGLCPPEPRNASAFFLLSSDTLVSLELVGSLTERAVKYVRVHWLLELLDVALEDGSFRYNFTALDSFLDHLHRAGLYPAFELMGVPLGSGMGMEWFHSEHFWQDLVEQLLGRYWRRYGRAYVAEWRLETWNEPDLRVYNLLNFTVDSYLTYVKAIRSGLDALAANEWNVNGRAMLTLPSAGASFRFNLYGPAGLFRAEAHHPLCWAIVKLCHFMPDRCPVDTITFHRKGSGRWASEVVAGGRELLADVLYRFPNVSRLEFANDEADPVAGWSTARPFQADVRYAAMLFSIVAQHWAAMADPTDRFGERFGFLSHDNAFLAYHPHEFEQRTLLARFQMNETVPPHVQFVVKPAYAALGMLGKLGPLATRTRFRAGNVSYIVSFDDRTPPSYLCLLASRSNDSSPMSVKRSHFNYTVPLDLFQKGPAAASLGTRSSPSRLSYLIEAIQDGLNDPFRVWQWQGRPAYPSTDQLAAMRAVQFPTVLDSGNVPQVMESGVNNVTEITLSYRLRAPWIVSVRVCSDDSTPGPVQRLRVRLVFKEEVLIFWSLPRSGNVRCIRTYEVWFKATTGGGCLWRPINDRKHTPFTFLQYVANATMDEHQRHVGSWLKKRTESDACSGVSGRYKVRAIDMFNQAGPFSSVYHYVENDSDYY